MTEVAADNENEGAGQRKLTEAQWTEIVEVYEIEGTDASVLAARYGITPAGLSKGLKKRNAIKGRRAHELKAKVQEATKAKIVENAVGEVEDNLEKRRKAVQSVKSEVEQSARWIQHRGMELLANAKTAGLPFSTEMANIKTLEKMMTLIQKGHRERLIALDADTLVDTDTLPELTIRELTTVEIEKLRSSQAEDDGIAIAEDFDVLDSLADERKHGPAPKPSVRSAAAPAGGLPESDLDEDLGGRLVKDADGD